MLDSNVLVLNRSYMPIHVTSARRAFTLIYQDVAHAVDAEYQTFDFDAWRRLRPSGGDDAIGTPDGSIRVRPLTSAVAPLSEGAGWFDRLYAGEPDLMKVILKPDSAC